MIDCIKGKRILLLYARFFEYDKIVKEKLEERGALVDLYDARANISVFSKAILKKTDRFYLKKQIKFHKNVALKKRSYSFDYIFTNENLCFEVIRNYREAFPNAFFILYLDDSVENFRNINESFKYYDKVLTFDRIDSSKYKILFRPLFFNDYIKIKKDSARKHEYDICFIGTAHSDRLYIINNFLKHYSSTNFLLYLYLQSWFMYIYYFITKKEYRHYGFSFFKYKKIKMEDVANLMSKSNVMLDIQHPKQTGLTIRTIESIGMGKKIITTNQDIVNYDFYNANNIMIIDRKNPCIDEVFLKRDYIELEKSVYNKYSIDAWLDDVFGR